jgi:hypothetical protein
MTIVTGGRDDLGGDLPRLGQARSRCRNEAHAIAGAIPRQLAQLRVAMAAGPAPRLLVVVRLSSELTVQAVRQDCSFAKKRESPPAFLVVQWR